MKILLVASPTVRHTERMPPYGVLALYWYVRRSHAVDFLDGTHLSDAEIVERACSGYDVVALSAGFTATVHRTIAIGRAIRERRPDTTLVTGGAHATFDYEHLLDQGFDFVVRHEGEETFDELLTWLRGVRTTGIETVRGLAYRRDGQAVLTPDRPLIADLDTLPFPDLDGLPLDQYRMASGERMFLLESSRGCVHRCKFCYTPAMWRRWRGKSAARVAAEFRAYRDKGLEYILVTDDNIAANPRRVRDLCAIMASWSDKVPWEAAVCQDTIARTPWLPAAMRAAGCETIQSAIDSATQKVLDYYGKPTSRAVMRRAFGAVRRAGLVVNTQVIVGAPVEGLADAWSSLSFGRRWADVLTISTLEPRPGTTFWNETYRDSTRAFGQGISLLHPQPRAIEALVICHYLLFYLHPRTLLRALAGSGAQKRQLRWHMLMYAGTALKKLVGALGRPSPQEGS